METGGLDWGLGMGGLEFGGLGLGLRARDQEWRLGARAWGDKG